MLKTILAIIGGIVVSIVLLLVLGLFVVRWKLRKLVNQYKGMAEAAAVSGNGQFVPPMRIRLRPDNGHEWLNSEWIKSLGDEISDKGFVRIGTFSTVPETLPFEAWHDPQRSIYATINEHPSNEVWLDFVSLGQNGSMFTFSSGRGDQFPRPDNVVLEHMTDAEPIELLESFLDNRPDLPAIQTSAESFPSAFEEAWQRVMDFRVEQGTPSEDEIRRLCFADPEDADDEAVKQIHEMWQLEIGNARRRQVREAFLTNSGLTALEWDRMRDRAIFVFDELPAMEIAEIMIDGGRIDDFDDEYGDPFDAIEDRVNELMGELSTREIFAKLNAEQNPDDRFEKIGEVSEPVPADVYLGPEIIE